MRRPAAKDTIVASQFSDPYHCFGAFFGCRWPLLHNSQWFTVASNTAMKVNFKLRVGVE